MRKVMNQSRDNPLENWINTGQKDSRAFDKERSVLIKLAQRVLENVPDEVVDKASNQKQTIAVHFSRNLTRR